MADLPSIVLKRQKDTTIVYASQMVKKSSSMSLKCAVRDFLKIEIGIRSRTLSAELRLKTKKLRGERR